VKQVTGTESLCMMSIMKYLYDKAPCKLIKRHEKRDFIRKSVIKISIILWPKICLKKSKFRFSQNHPAAS